MRRQKSCGRCLEVCKFASILRSSKISPDSRWRKPHAALAAAPYAAFSKTASQLGAGCSCAAFLCLQGSARICIAVMYAPQKSLQGPPACSHISQQQRARHDGSAHLLVIVIALECRLLLRGGSLQLLLLLHRVPSKCGKQPARRQRRKGCVVRWLCCLLSLQ